MDFQAQAHPLLPYLIAAIVLVIFCLLIFLVLTLRKARKTEPLQLAIEEDAKSKEPQSGKRKSGSLSRFAHARAFSTSFSRAMRFLRQSVAGRDYLYQIPWYLVVGESGSGKTTLLESAGIRASLTDRAEDFGIHQAIQWRFFNRGITLDVYGDYVLRPEDLTSDEIGWETLLKQLHSHRARRPIDGIVIALPCQDFLSQAIDVQALEAKAARLCDKLWLAQKTLGLAFPVYVIVTKCDAIQGFRGFCQEIPDRNRQDIFGWSSPYSLTASFIPAWADEAFDSLASDLQRLQCEIFAERRESSNADEVFMFPGEFETMRDSMRVFLARLFKETAYRESFYFRGLYFCGDIGPEEIEPAPPAMEVNYVPDPFAEPGLEPPSTPSSPSPQVPTRRPIFLTRLFAEKIFPESSVARPIPMVFRSKSRLVWGAQVTALLLAIVLAWGTTARYRTMIQVERKTLLPILQQVAGKMGVTSALPSEAQTGLDQPACYLTNNMHQLVISEFSTVFIPSSLASSLNESVKQAMLPAYRQQVLSAAKQQLEFLAAKLSTPVPPASPAAVSTAAEPVGLENFKTYPVEKTQELQALQSFTLDLEKLQLNINRYQVLITPGKGTTEDLRGLLGYLGCQLPVNTRDKQYFHNEDFENLLQQANGVPFDEKQFWGGMSDKLARLDQNFLNARFAENPVLVTLTDVQSQINNLEDRQAGTYEGLKNLDGRITLLRTLLSHPTLSWLSKPNLDLTDPFYQAAVDPVRNTNFFRPGMESEIRAAAEAQFQNLKTKLETTDTDLTGNLLESEGGALKLSPTTVALQLDLENVLNLPFMAMEPTGTMRSELEPHTRLMWNSDLLNEALGLYETYDRFIAEGLRNSPLPLRTEFRRIALSRLELNMLDLIAHAQTYEPVPVSEAENSTAGKNTAEVKSFEDAEAPLSQLLDVFHKLGLSASYAKLQKVTTSQAAALLAMLDAELTSEQPYVEKDGNFFWWHGESAPALMAFDVRTPEELEAYLTFKRQRIESLSTQATPLLSFLGSRASGLSDTQARTHDKWRQIVAAMKTYDQKIPGNSVALLQDFIRTDMNKFNPDQYCQGVAVGDAETQSSNFFIQTRDALREGIYERCKYLADMAAFRNYSEVAKLFDQTLAGKFPFAPSGAEDFSNEADPTAIQAFYQLFDAHENATHLALTLTSRFGPTRAPALSFLDQMEKLRPAFSSLLSDQKDANVMALDFVPHFRANKDEETGGNQIAGWTLSVGTDQYRDHEPERTGRWQVGEPVRLSLRWAKDSPALPAPGKDQPDLHVEDRDATFEYSDAWSLFTLLRKHHAPVADFPRLVDPHPYTLEFALGTMAALSSASKKSILVPQETKVFVQLSIMPPGKKESLSLPTFPARAPLLILATSE